MPSELVRPDRVLLYYLARKIDESEKDGIDTQTICRDIQTIQEKSDVKLYEMFSLNDDIDSTELKGELKQLRELKKIEVQPDGSIRPLGMGRLSGGFLQLPQEIEAAIDATVDGTNHSEN
jgi:hypothetical protein